MAGCASLDDGRAALTVVRGLEIGRAEKINRSFLDSFDWRLWNAGYVLERLTAPDGTALLLRDRASAGKGGGVLVAADQRAIPRFASDLPAGFLSDRIGPLLSMRALMPLAEVRGRRCMVIWRDDEGKEVVRGSLEDVRVSLPGRRTKGDPLGLRLFLEPVRGYEKALEKLTERLSAQGGFQAKDGGLFEEAMARLGRTPGAYSSKLNLTLVPEMRADEAMQVILRSLFDAMTLNEQGLIDDVDTEFLHDFRVAIRRTRSALAQIKGVLPERTVSKYKKAFRWLGQVTGPMRDLDVYLLTFNDYRDYLPDDFRDSLDPLRAELERRRAREFKAVVRVLKGARYKRLKEGWAETLDGLSAAPPSAQNAARPVKDVADARIWKLYKKVLAEGAAINDTSPPEALHELRKTCKKLRYLMEFFQSLYDKGQAKDRIKALKVLQDDLGAFQDYAVQADTLEMLAAEMEEAGTVPRETLLAMAILTGALMDRQQAARDAFAGIFDAFAARDSRALFKALYKS
jgi:CHAD domain-containing protein